MNRLTAVAALAAAAFAVAGCTDSGEDPVEVSGAQKSCVAGPTEDGYAGNCEVALADERLSGRNEVVFIEIPGTSPVEYVGTSVISNERGYWAAGCTGTIDDDSGAQAYDCVYLGAGDYLGMTYEAHLEGTDYPDYVTGMLSTG